MAQRRLVLFDVDGTLTKSRASITKKMEDFLQELKTKVHVGLVGGSDLSKIAEQMTAIDAGDVFTEDKSKQIECLIKKYEYVFAENGLVAYGQGKLIGKQSILNELGEERTQRLINFSLGYLSKLTIPKKRGTFVEFRNGLINISPIGRSCTREEREEFFEYDKQHGIRAKFVEALHEEFDKTDVQMDYVIGGQISIDCFPKGWDKRYCLRYLTIEGDDQKFKNYDEVYFFGDRCEPGGNDYPLFKDNRVKGFAVKSPDDTMEQLKKLFF